MHTARLCFIILLTFGCAKSVPQPPSSTRITAETHTVQASGQPTEAELTLHAQNGVSLVVDLRGSSEDRGFNEEAVVEKLGMTYISLPITSRDDLTLEHARELDQILSRAQGPALLHCRSGNRVGALVALRAGLDLELSTDSALEIGREHGLTSLEEHARGILEQRTLAPTGDGPSSSSGE